MIWLLRNWKLLVAGAGVLAIIAFAFHYRSLQSTIREQAAQIGALEVAKAIQDETIAQQADALKEFEDAQARQRDFLETERAARAVDDDAIRNLGIRDPTAGTSDVNAADSLRRQRLREITRD